MIRGRLSQGFFILGAGGLLLGVVLAVLLRIELFASGVTYFVDANGAPAARAYEAVLSLHGTASTLFGALAMLIGGYGYRLVPRWAETDRTTACPLGWLALLLLTLGFALTASGAAGYEKAPVAGFFAAGVAYLLIAVDFIITGISRRRSLVTWQIPAVFAITLAALLLSYEIISILRAFSDPIITAQDFSYMARNAGYASLLIATLGTVTSLGPRARTGKMTAMVLCLSLMILAFCLLGMKTGGNSALLIGFIQAPVVIAGALIIGRMQGADGNELAFASALIACVLALASAEFTPVMFINVHVLSETQYFVAIEHLGIAMASLAALCAVFLSDLPSNALKTTAGSTFMLGALVFLIGMSVVVAMQISLGMMGMPARYMDYPAIFEWRNAVASVATGIATAGFGVGVIGLVLMYRRKAA